MVRCIVVLVDGLWVLWESWIMCLVMCDGGISVWF